MKLLFPSAARPALHFDITDARGKNACGSIDRCRRADADGWYSST